jgi:hypothetical protein
VISLIYAGAYFLIFIVIFIPFAVTVSQLLKLILGCSLVFVKGGIVTLHVNFARVLSVKERMLGFLGIV